MEAGEPEETEKTEPKTLEELLQDTLARVDVLSKTISAQEQAIKNQTRFEWFDPHFHIWDNQNQIHDPVIVEGYGGKWSWKDQLKQAKIFTDHNVTWHQGCCVESMCNNLDFIKEALWLEKQLPDNSEMKIIAGCDLSQNSAYLELLLNTMSSLIPGLVAVRQTVNFEPSWPRVTQDYIKNETWKQNFHILAKYGLHFDIQLNPGQMEDFATYMQAEIRRSRRKGRRGRGPYSYGNRSIPNVIINHLGCCKNPDNEEEYATWKAGIETLSKVSNMYIKISMLPFSDSENWDKKDGKVHEMVKFVIQQFTPQKCMFASNYPIDLKDGADPERLVKAFLMFSDHLDFKSKEFLWGKTAKKAYGIS